jgi:hypothetical protein
MKIRRETFLAQANENHASHAGIASMHSRAGRALCARSPQIAAIFASSECRQHRSTRGPERPFAFASPLFMGARRLRAKDPEPACTHALSGGRARTGGVVSTGRVVPPPDEWIDSRRRRLSPFPACSCPRGSVPGVLTNRAGDRMASSRFARWRWRAAGLWIRCGLKGLMTRS